MSNLLIPCPKCRRGVLRVEVRGMRVRGSCPECRFTTGWLVVPAFRVPRAYLRERVDRVASAYRRVRAETIWLPGQVSGQAVRS